MHCLASWCGKNESSKDRLLFPLPGVSLETLHDKVAEWLRRWTANPIRSPCVGSNPILVELLLSMLKIHQTSEQRST